MSANPPQEWQADRRFDASVRGFDPYPDSAASDSAIPRATRSGALTSAAVDLITRKLNWRPGGSYEVINGAVGQARDFGRCANSESV
ncbi:hypothetical protein [Bradyrhizobium sp. CCGE-LA001]|uniref:hypothetical protein n=1 Tax=Bradyrhizobium sp. CCGE-LA001 TaxID=1223566 RepID=UPI0011982097|nr:hypothetical protein [Bradyrhizobium sp. CCGE-LA001]